MKKIGILLFVLAMTFMSCSKDDTQESSDSLIGTWEHIESGNGYSYKEVLTFNANNTGRLVDTDFDEGVTTNYSIDYTWSINGTNIAFDFIGSYSDELPYYIMNNQLTINWGGDIFIYSRK